MMAIIRVVPPSPVRLVDDASFCCDTDRLPPNAIARAKSCPAPAPFLSHLLLLLLGFPRGPRFGQGRDDGLVAVRRGGPRRLLEGGLVGSNQGGALGGGRGGEVAEGGGGGGGSGRGGGLGESGAGRRRKKRERGAGTGRLLFFIFFFVPALFCCTRPRHPSFSLLERAFKSASSATTAAFSARAAARAPSREVALAWEREERDDKGQAQKDARSELRRGGGGRKRRKIRRRRRRKKDEDEAKKS